MRVKAGRAEVVTAVARVRVVDQRAHGQAVRAGCGGRRGGQRERRARRRVPRGEVCLDREHVHGCDRCPERRVIRHGVFNAVLEGRFHASREGLWGALATRREGRGNGKRHGPGDTPGEQLFAAAPARRGLVGDLQILDGRSRQLRREDAPQSRLVRVAGRACGSERNFHGHGHLVNFSRHGRRRGRRGLRGTWRWIHGNGWHGRVCRGCSAHIAAAVYGVCQIRIVKGEET